jgi:hypothetical protein
MSENYYQDLIRFGRCTICGGVCASIGYGKEKFKNFEYYCCSEDCRAKAREVVDCEIELYGEI